jgi:hypothetical protein
MEESAYVAKLTMNELHCALGHVAQGAILYVVKQGLIEGVKLDSTSTPEFCDACTKAKATISSRDSKSCIHLWGICKGITQTLILDTLTVMPKVSQSTDGNLLWSVVYLSDTVCPCVGVADDTQLALADPHLLRWPWPVTGGYAAGVP